MKYIDRVYGEAEITEQVLLELIASPAIQRLKHIDQGGYLPGYVVDMSAADLSDYANSRYAHSLGVCILLKKFNAPLEEQIAGLIHDVNHGTFSHCLDYALSSGSEKEQNHQDNSFKAFVMRSDIPVILKKFDIDVEFILNDGNFPLKEKDLPDLCADRIDYSLRTATIYGDLGAADRNDILAKLTVRDGNWTFVDLPSAKKYAELFNYMNSKFYAGFASGVMLKTVGLYVKHALEKGYVTYDDLYTTDDEVLSKIAAHHADDERLRILFDRMNAKIKVVDDPENYEVDVWCKSRIVDPLFDDHGKLTRLSDAEPAWKEVVAKESKPKHYFLRFER